MSKELIVSNTESEIYPPVMRDLDKFVKITEASRILGFSSFESVKDLVDAKILSSYSLPGTSRIRLLLSELLELKSKNIQIKEINRNPLNSGRRGRPKKYANP